MLSRYAGRCWPFFGLLALLVLAAMGFMRHGSVSAMHSQLAAQLQPSLSLLLAQGESRGYQALLQRYHPVSSWQVQVLDRDGQAVAVWPAPVAANRWGIAAQPLQTLREHFVETLAKTERIALEHQGRKVGELLIYRPQGVFLLSWQSFFYFASMVLAVAGLVSLVRIGVVPFAAQTLAKLPGAAEAEHRESLAQRIGVPLEKLGVGVVRVNREACVANMNAAAEAMTGWRASEACGLPVTSVVKTELSHEVTEGLGSGSLGVYADVGFTREFSLSQRNESVLPVLITQIPLKRHEEADGLLFIMVDVSHQRAELERLRREATLAAKALDYMSDGLAVADRYGRITRSNQKMHDLFDYSEGELDGLTVSKLMPVPFLNDANTSLRSYLPQDRGTAPAVVGWRKDASTFALDLRVEELFEDDHAFLMLIRDRASRQHEENLAQRFAAVSAASPCGLLILETEHGYCNAANPQAVIDLGYAQDQLRRMSLKHLIEDMDDQVMQEKFALLQSGQERYCDMLVQVQLADGRRQPAQLRLAWSGEEEPAMVLAFINFH